jgi:hypothetical protein
MFRHPVAGVAERLGMADQVGGFQQRFAWPLPFDDGNEIEDGDRDHDSPCKLVPEEIRREG